MPSLNWEAFDSLSGSRSQNFENLCRSLIRLHFGQHGQFLARKNQPGVEFHLKLLETSQILGSPPRWYGWQCKLHSRNKNGDLNSASRKDIVDSLDKTEKELLDLTDWVLWTPYTLSKKDQTWFMGLKTRFQLHQWTDVDIETYLCGPGVILRSTYFDELVLTPEQLEQYHHLSVSPIRERWLEQVHQSIDAERSIRRMLGEPGSWDQMIVVGKRLKKTADIISDEKSTLSTKLENAIKPFVSACSVFADTLLNFHTILADGDLDIIHQKLSERKTLIDKQVLIAPGLLRTSNLSIALDATNALDDMRIAQELLDEVGEFIGVGVVVVLADAGGGKTQMAAQLTARQASGRPAGILFHGRDLHRGQTLDDIARHFSINGNPLISMEKVLAALDAAGKRSRCRLPIVIDGLNEAENPRDWKASLGTISETVKLYPNVLIVCTLRTGERQREDQPQARVLQSTSRESFAVMALPDSVRKIESGGFGGDVYEAVKKYFNYFKIDSGDAEIPMELFQHQLTLRIFCEVTNPDRKSKVNVNYFPATLSLLFEQYIANACKRISQMTNLARLYSIEDVEALVYNLGIEMWNVQQYEISEKNFRTIVSDTSDWGSSIVNLFAQEGIIFRNPGDKPGEYVITPVYDVLGGYIIASALLTKFVSDRTFEWLKKPETIESFSGKNSHPLAVDIFRSLVSLIPRRLPGCQLWKNTPDSFRDTALRFTMGIEPKYIDSDTITALLKLFKDNPKGRDYLFSKLQGTRSAVDHPFNAKFIDSALRAMTVVERDLSWTEWIRKTRSEKLKDILEIELKWKKDFSMRTPSDLLRAKWLMWFLTSTDHELRDVVNRALYWFGRGAPEMLFEESISSLKVNDPYVPERMLAASYGVAMARHVDLSDQTFVKITLPKYARYLYDSLFAKDALFGTTHLLLREYAFRTIELVVLHNPNLFSSEEIKRSRSPFTDGGLRNWGESETFKNEQCYGFNSPFRMDFENYTLGSLVPGRGNYDYDHTGYRKIRAQVLWRVEQLGWSSELFKEVDSLIANDRNWSRTGSYAKKTDRYGKKYSWIAFFEMSGLLHDRGVLENWRERTSSVDIDPSFPECVTKKQLIKADFLGDPEMDMQEWITNGPLPDVKPYFRLKKIQQVEGHWIALDGFVVQQDEARGRRSFCFIRSFLVPTRDVASFFNHISHQDLAGRWLPEKPNVIYAFAGEIPWCDTFPKNDLSEFTFVTKEKIVKVKKNQQEFYLDGKKIKWSQIDMIRRRVFGNAIGETKAQQPISDEDLERIEVREVPVEVEEVEKGYAKFNAQIPVRDFGWEGYQTVASDAGHATMLAKEIAFDLELIGQPQTFDLFTKSGIRATFNVSDQGDDFNNHQSLFFIREDFLKTYLKKNDLVMIWAIWGERGYSHVQIDKLFHKPDRPEKSYAVFSSVKRYEEG